MRFGVILPNYEAWASTEAIEEVAVKAEELGYDSVWTTDHVIVPKRWENPYGRVYETLSTLAFVAGKTQDVKLGTSILVLPQRNPIVVAKQTSAIDRLSGGRLILGVGVGWLEDEFEMLGASFRSRGRMADEAIRLMRTLWRTGRPSFDGEFYSFEDVAFHPKPAQPRGPPIWIGGQSDAALRRCASLGDGWHPTGVSPSELEGGSRKIRSTSDGDVTLSVRMRVNMGGRRPKDYRKYMVAGQMSSITEQVEAFADQGLQHMVCHFAPKEIDAHLEQMSEFALEVKPSF